MAAKNTYTCYYRNKFKRNIAEVELPHRPEAGEIVHIKNKTEWIKHQVTQVITCINKSNVSYIVEVE